MQQLTSEAIPRVVEQYSDMILRVAWQYLQSRADAEDVTQDVFLKLLDAPEFTSEEHMKAWLIRVTINRCKDILKSAWNRRTVALADDWPLAAPEHQGVMEELSQLGEEDRSIVYLYYYEKYKVPEIAQMLGKNESTISSRLNRARKKLKDILTEGGYRHV